MRIDRRGWMGLAAAAFAPPLRAATQPCPIPFPQTLTVHAGMNRYPQSISAITAYALAELQDYGLPGMTIALADGLGFRASINVGLANLSKGMAIRPDMLFQIGSIGKSLVALCLYRLAEEGLIDLDQPLSRYLSLSAMPAASFSIQQILNHSAGLPDEGKIWPDTSDGRYWTGFQPGARFSYSNVGYKFLGPLITAVTGRPHAEIILDTILTPLGMTGAVPHIVTADRPRFASGYVPLLDDRPALSQAPLVEGPWADGDYCAGAICASSEAMSAYLAYILRLGMGHGAPILSDKSVSRLLATDMAAPGLGPNLRYASGFQKETSPDGTILSHMGGMVLFKSAYHADISASLACFASVNGRVGRYSPKHVSRFAISAMKAEKAGRSLPVATASRAAITVSARDMEPGRYGCTSHASIDIIADGAALYLSHEGVRARLEKNGDRKIITDHPALSEYELELPQGGMAADRFWWGPHLFSRRPEPAEVAAPDHLTGLCGTYVSAETGYGTCRIFYRDGDLFSQFHGRLSKNVDGYYRAHDDEGGLERLWFDRETNGRMMRLCISGTHYFRID